MSISMLSIKIIKPITVWSEAIKCLVSKFPSFPSFFTVSSCLNLFFFLETSESRNDKSWQASLSNKNIKLE